MSVILPTSWDDLGMDWDNPDPWNMNYWRALLLAAKERSDVYTNGGSAGRYYQAATKEILVSSSHCLFSREYSLGVCINSMFYLEAVLGQLSGFFVDISQPIGAPAYNIVVGARYVYRQAKTQYEVGVDECLTEELRPWVAYQWLKSHYTTALLKKYLKQRKAVIDKWLYCMADQGIFSFSSYGTASPAVLNRVHAFDRVGNGGDDGWAGNPPLSVSDCENACDVVYDNSGSLPQGDWWPTTGQSLDWFTWTTGATGWQYYVHTSVIDVRSWKRTSEFSLYLGFPKACAMDTWMAVDIGTPPYGYTAVFDPTGFFPLVDMPIPGTYKVISNQQHAAGGGLEWIKLGTDTLAIRPVWADVVIPPFPDWAYVYRGAAFRQPRTVMKFDIDGGFAFRPAS